MNLKMRANLKFLRANYVRIQRQQTPVKPLFQDEKKPTHNEFSLALVVLYGGAGGI